MKKSLSLFIMSTLLFTGLTQVTNAQTINRDTSEASITFEACALSLGELSNLELGNHKIGETTGNTYSATSAQSAVVTDFRGLADGAWYLNASISNFTDDNDVSTLPGFSLQFNNPSTTAVDPTNTLAGPAAITPTLNYLGEENGSVNFLNATDGEGRGSWNGSWSEVVLSIPEGSETVGEHTATITWVLSDAPQ